MSGPHQVNDDDSDRQGEGGHELKVNESFSADPAYFFHISHPGDPAHYSKKNTIGAMSILISLTKISPSTLSCSPKAGKKIPDGYTQQNGGEDLHGQISKIDSHKDTSFIL